MNNYTQISYEERVIIADLLRKNKSYYYIAKWLNRKYDTIKKEVERNSVENIYGETVYRAKDAHKLYLKRRKKSKEKCRIIENNKDIEDKIFHLITQRQLSPEQISNRYKTVSFQTIYNWIYRIKDKERKRKLLDNLRRQGKKYRKNKSKQSCFKSSIAIKTMIDKRPDKINKRERIGDFEGDTIVLSYKKRLFTLVDRKSRYVFIRFVDSKDGLANSIHQLMVDINKESQREILSVTFDNGVEFSYHDLIQLDTGIDIYFAYPYHSWERGTSENTNGLVRQYFPKGKHYDTICEKYIQQVQDKLNHRPRKCLGWLTPHEVFVEGKKIEEFQVQGLI